MDSTEEIECWKVVKRLKSGKIVSCVVTGPIQTEYREGVWNKSDNRLSNLGYDICAFGDEESAAKFFNAYYGRFNYCEFELWKCRGRNCRAVDVGFVNPSVMRRASLRYRHIAGRRITMMDVVLSVLKESLHAAKSTFPKGTIMVKELMLERKIGQP